MYYKKIGEDTTGETNKIQLIATSESESELLKLFEETNAQNLQVTNEIAFYQRRQTEKEFEISSLKGENKFYRGENERLKKELDEITKKVMSGIMPQITFLIIKGLFEQEFRHEVDIAFEEIEALFDKLEEEYWGKEAGENA